MARRRNDGLGLAEATPAEPKAVEYNQVPIQKTVTDLESFKDIKLLKPWNFEAAKNLEEAQARLGNDSAKLLAVINSGLRADAAAVLSEDPSGWYLPGEKAGEVGELFVGDIVDSDRLNALENGLAKSSFGFQSIARDLPEDVKKAMSAKNRAAKDAAREFIRNNEVIRNTLK